MPSDWVMLPHWAKTRKSAAFMLQCPEMPTFSFLYSPRKKGNDQEDYIVASPSPFGCGQGVFDLLNSTLPPSLTLHREGRDYGPIPNLL